MDPLTMSLLFGLAAVFTPYIITQPHHVHALLVVLCCVFFSKSVTNFHDAVDLDLPNSTMVVFAAIAFFSAVVNCPLSWLSLILYSDPAEVPVSERPAPISEWFRQPRQLVPPDSNSQHRQPQHASSDVAEAIFYMQLFERAEAEKDELEDEKAELEALVKQLEGEKAYVEMERDDNRRWSARHESRADVYASMVIDYKCARDERIYSRTCPSCEFEVARLTGKAAVAEDNITSLEASIKTTKAETEKALAEKDSLLEEKDKIIEDKDKVIFHKDREAELYNRRQLLMTMGRVDMELSSKKRELESVRTEKDAQIARLNDIINSRRYCCCGRCGPALPSGPRNDGDDDGSDDTNGGPPQGGNAQHPTTAQEPSGAPPCPVGDSSTRPAPTAGAPSDDGAAPVASQPASPASSPLSSVPASPISAPAPPAPEPPTSTPAASASDPAPLDIGSSGPHPPAHET